MGHAVTRLQRFIVIGGLCALWLFVPMLGFGASSRGRNPVARSTKRYAVILVLDAARPDDFDLVPMPHFDALVKRGVTYSQAFVGQELANTPPSHATIGSGLLPKHTGIPDFLWANPQTHQLDNPTELSNILAGDLEHVLSQHHASSIAASIKATDPSARIEAVAGHKCYASDTLGGPSADYILCALIYHNRWVASAIGNHRPPPGAINNYAWDVPIPPPSSGFGPAVQQWRVGSENAWTVHYGLWAFRKTHYPRVVMMNLAETDVLGHYTTSKTVIGKVMAGFDSLLGQIEATYKRAGILNRTDFFILADHGMSPIHSVLPYSTLTNAVADAGATAVYIEHDTAAAIGLVQNRQAQAVARNVFRLGGSLVDATYYKTLVHGRWMYRLAGARSIVSPSLKRAYLRLANTMASDSSADVYAIYAPHVSSRTSVANGYIWKEGHLGPQWDDQHIPLIIAGPGVRSGVTSNYPARLVDVAPTVESLLGGKPNRVDGVVLQDALTHQTPSGLAALRKRGAILLPVVQALKARSGYR